VIFSCSSVISASSWTRCVEEFLEEEVNDSCFGIILTVYDHKFFSFHCIRAFQILSVTFFYLPYLLSGMSHTITGCHHSV
jgi:hypothetical protein